MTRVLRSRVPWSKVACGGLAFLGGMQAGVAASSFHGSVEPSAKVLYWVLFLASGAPFIWFAYAIEGPRRWLGWVLLGNGLLMLVLAGVVLAYPSLEGPSGRAFLCSLTSGALLVAAGILGLLLGRSKPSRPLRTGRTA